MRVKSLELTRSQLCYYLHYSGSFIGQLSGNTETTPRSVSSQDYLALDSAFCQKAVLITNLS